ncbi:hypothetical protein ES703_09533 [subsurface metagenome]
MLHIKNILKIFNTINKKRIKVVITFLLLLFIAVNILNIILARNIKDTELKPKSPNPQR